MPANILGGTVIFVMQLERMTAFYRDAMTLAVTHADTQIAVLENDATHLVLHAIPPAVAAGIEIADPPVAREDTAIKPFFYVADFAVARVAATAHGGRFDPAAKEWSARGFRACEGVDPEGNVIQIRASVR